MGRHRWATQAGGRSSSDDGALEQGSNTPRLRIAFGVAAMCVVLIASACLIIFLQQPNEPLAAISIDKVGTAERPAMHPDGMESRGPDGVDDNQKSEGTQKGAANGGDVMVHVAGAVHEPGVVSLRDGSRTFEAIEAAGGALPEAALNAVNLAAPLSDGAQLYVPTVSEQVDAGTGPAATKEGSGLVNLNSASSDELQTLSGVGPVLAGRIVAWREEHGGFSSVADLDAVSGVGEAMMASLADLVTV